MRKISLFIGIICLLLAKSPLSAQRQMEKLNRGLVAVRTSSTQVFLSWRLLGNDPENIAFNLYRDGVKVNPLPITTATNYTDVTSVATQYVVKPTINGVETGESNQSSVWANNSFDIPMSIPDSLTMPDGIRCGYSPNDCSTGDVDGDGEYEIIVKWDPSNAKDNSQSGYTGNVYLDCYKLNGTKLWRIDLGKNIRAGAHYTQFQVADYDGDGKAEVACKTAPGTKDGLGAFLSKGVAASNTSTINNTDYRNSGGYILTGSEYLTVFNGLTGAELATANFIPARGTVGSWGDTYGNRVDRFLACTAYFDGIHPSIVMCRGYYTRAVVAAWDYRNGTLTSRWTYDSGNSAGVGAYGQGNHNLSVADVDDDGKDEVIYGASAFDDNGALLYRTGQGHGDAIHVTDLVPDRKGLEVWEVHEETGTEIKGYEMHDAKTGTILWGEFTGSDNGRGLAANIDASSRGFEMWSAAGPGVSNCNGTTISTNSPSMNFRIYWDGDLQDELLDGTTISKYGVGALLSATNCSSNNGSKSTPNLSADILGDWREEVIFRTNDNRNLRIFTTTIPTTNRLYTLMHDTHYRNSVSWENTGYNQPPHAGFYIGDDMDTPPASAIYNGEKRWKAGSTWDNNSTASWTDSLNQVAPFKNGDGVLFDITAGANAVVALNGDLSPKSLKVNSPYSVTLGGVGTLNGEMSLRKLGGGNLILNNNNNYTGSTTIWNGDFYNNGVLSNSEVFIKSFVKLAGDGSFGNNVSLAGNTVLSPGEMTGEAASMTFSKSLKEQGMVNYMFDMVMNGAGTMVANDTLVVGGDWVVSGKSTINLNVVNGTLKSGDYTLMKISGAVPSDLAKVDVVGVPATLGYILVNNGGNIILHVKSPTELHWKGNVSQTWDLGKTFNWLEGSTPQIFMSNDSVLFDDNATVKVATINENVAPALVTVNSTTNYIFNGTANIEGVGGLTKKGTSKLTITNTNKFTGPVVINGGAVEVPTLSNGGVASPLGAASNLAANIQLNGGKLSYYGPTVTTDRGLTVGQNSGTLVVVNPSAILTTTGKLTGAGKLIKEGAGRLVLSSASDYKGGTLLKAGVVALANDVANTSGLGSGGDTITFQGGTLQMFDSNTTDNSSSWNIVVPSTYTGTLNTDGKSTVSGSLTGAGTLNYYTNYTSNVFAADASKFSGTINVTTDTDGGWFIGNNTKGYAGAKINLNNLVTMIYRLASNVTIPIGDLTGGPTSVLGAGGTGASTITWEVGARNANSTFSGSISNAQYSGTGAVAAIIKKGTGTWTLTNANTFSGGTKVNEGVLMVNNTLGSGLGTGTVAVNSGATIAGTGIISGALTVNSGGTLSPGNGGTGTFTVNNSVNLLLGSTWVVDIDKPNNKCDLLTLTGTLTLGGKLQIVPTGTTTFAAGDQFKIANGSVSGAVSGIVPTEPGAGLAWDLSELVTKGIIKVTAASGVNLLEMTTKVFPNPVTTKLNIELGVEVSECETSLQSIYGQTIYQQTQSHISATQIDLTAIPKGVYLLKVKADKQEFVKKIVKE